MGKMNSSGARFLTYYHGFYFCFHFSLHSGSRPTKAGEQTGLPAISPPNSAGHVVQVTARSALWFPEHLSQILKTLGEKRRK